MFRKNPLLTFGKTVANIVQSICLVSLAIISLNCVQTILKMHLYGLLLVVAEEQY